MVKFQVCKFCFDPCSILSDETCCSGCDILSANREILRWRNLYLDMCIKDIITLDSRVRNLFLSISCSEFVKKSAEENLKDCIEINEKV
jgi:hypothetical protein